MNRLMIKAIRKMMPHQGNSKLVKHAVTIADAGVLANENGDQKLSEEIFVLFEEHLALLRQRGVEV